MIGYGFRCYGRGGFNFSPIFEIVIWVLGVFRGGVVLLPFLYILRSRHKELFT